MIPGFARAERQWENSNPFDGDCTCLDDELFICPECGDCDAVKEGDCSCGGQIILASEETRIETYPSVNCPRHGEPDEEEDR